ncbi:membrane protein [Streptomyces phage Doxi13]|nr:membrane protein [Streptomyces phage Doxi13]
MSKNVKSILTTAMLNADGKTETDAETTEPTTEPEGFAADRKRFLKRAVIATLATAAVTALAIRVFGTTEDEDTTETTED